MNTISEQFSFVAVGVHFRTTSFGIKATEARLLRNKKKQQQQQQILSNMKIPETS